MNIVILCYHRIGGSGVVAYEVGRAMAEDKGHMVHFMGLEPPFRLQEERSDRMRFHKVDVKEYPVFDFQPYSLALASQLSGIIKRYDIDVIHSHYALPHAVSALLARDISGRDVKCITTLHGTDITVVGAHPSMTDITCYAIKKSDVVTAVSDDLAQETAKQLCTGTAGIKTVYNFVNPQYFNPDLRSERICGKGKFIIIHVSNLRSVKRPLDVINIFNRIHNVMGDEVELHIVGEGPMQYEVESLVEQMGLEKSVKFLGIYREIGTLIASSDLFILPSQTESFGLVALESMACGVPVLASRVGGLQEVVDDGRSGFLFNVGDVDDAAEKAVRLLKDRDLYHSVREAALQDCREKFSMNNIVDQYEKIYMTAKANTGTR
ncbi:MAG: N-acetyl-alpha-D-glucosaminyl L-malate synthase BshA [bacterium]|nr:N-acetyl-alpha-D-glucosaminyl L-malate synthase BshA [bacterium]